MTIWRWEWDPDGGGLIDRVNKVALLGLDQGDVIPVNWSMWTKWFHNNVGIGNSANLWWPSRKGPHSAWILCDRCGLPFVMPTGFWMSTSSAAGMEHLGEMTWTGGPCPRCKADGHIATGSPVIYTASDGHGRVAVAGSAETALNGWEFLAEVEGGLTSGRLSVTDAATRLRSATGPFTRVADWLESRPVTAATAGALIAAIASLVGPQLAARNDSRTDDEQIVHIIDTVLDHYDKTHEPRNAGQRRNGAQKRDARPE